jgi:hypothetical protein
MIVDPSINWCVGGILLPWTPGSGIGATNLLNCIYTPTVLLHLPPIYSSLCSLALLHPASVGRKLASRVLTAPWPPTSSVHKSSARCLYFSAPSGSKVIALDLLLLHWILYFFILLSRALCSFTFNLAIVILLDLQMKMHLLVLEFVALYIRGV